MERETRKLREDQGWCRDPGSGPWLQCSETENSQAPGRRGRDPGSLMSGSIPSALGLPGETRTPAPSLAGSIHGIICTILSQTADEGASQGAHTARPSAWAGGPPESHFIPGSCASVRGTTEADAGSPTPPAKTLGPRLPLTPCLQEVRSPPGSARHSLTCTTWSSCDQHLSLCPLVQDTHRPRMR